MPPGSRSLGGGIASRVAPVLADASVQARRKMLGPTHDLVMKAQDSFFRLMGGEIRTTIGPLFVAIADSPESPEWAKRTFDLLGRGHGQWQAFLATSAGGAAVSSGLIPLLNNELAPVTQNLIAQNPNFVIDVASAAMLAATGRQPIGAMEAEARRQGISGTRFRWLMSGVEQGLTPGDALTALNRGMITEAVARRHLARAGLADDAIASTLALRRMLISPQEAAILENFGAISSGQGRRIADDWGMAADDYDRLAFGAGQPPPLDVLYRARRTGVIDQDRFERGIRQGPIRVEWFDVIDRLRFLPAPPETALAAATQNLLAVDEARQIWTEHGLRPDDFPWALESAGRPLGIEQAAELYNRGKITRAQARQMFLESTIKNKYVDLIFPLFQRLPTMELTVRLVREGAITPAQGVSNLLDLGFEQFYARALVELGTREQTGATRDLSVSMIRELYEEQAIGRTDAIDALAGLGYSVENAAWVLAIGELRRARRLQAGAVGRVRARYVAHRIDQREAENALDQLEVPPDQRADLVDTWQIEREVSVPSLTTSQVQQALRRGFIDAGGALRRLSEAGYAEDDARILVQLAAPAG